MKTRFNNHIIIVLVVLVTLNLLLFSGISPLHSIYNMQYDEWLFYLIGKGMVHGKVPYLELMDHKGPYLFYLFALMNILPTNHLGLFIVSTIAYVFIAIFVYKISDLILASCEPECRGELCEPEHRDSNSVSVIVALIIHMLLSSYYISFGTITSEIITLPFTLSSYYLFMKYLYSGETKHPLKYMINYGIGAGIVFFIKANAVLAYLPIAIYLFIYLLKDKEYVNLLKNAAVGLLSFVLALMPAVIYSFATGSFNDMIEGAFIINFLYTGRGLPSAGSVAESLYDTIIKFKEFTILCIFSVPALNYFCRRGEPAIIKHRLLSFYVLSLVINLYSVYMAYRPYTNYLAYLIFYLIPLLLLFVDGLCSVVQKVWKSNLTHTILLIVVIICINTLSYSLTYEQSNINGNIQRTVSRRVIDIYKKSDYYKKNPETLIVGHTLYLYEALNTFPNEKYFAIPVISRAVYKEPYDAIVAKISEGTEDVVILSFDGAMNDDLEFKEQVYDALTDNYILIGDTKYLDRKAEVYVKTNGN